MLKNWRYNSFYKNSTLLVMGNLCCAFLGFLYWLLAARLYSAEEVGLATAIISAINLLALLSRLGFGIGIMRFLPQESKKTNLVNSCITLSVIASVIFSALFILYLYYTSDYQLKKFLIVNYILFFFLFVSFYTVKEIISKLYIALRRSEYTFAQDSLWSSLKIVLVVILAKMGVLGIVFSWGISTIIIVFTSIYLFIPRLIVGYKYIIKIQINKKIKEILTFSFGNYIATVFQMLPQTILPLIIFKELNTKIVAYFYIAWMISNLLFSLSRVVGFTFLSEAAFQTTDFQTTETSSVDSIVFRAIKFVYLISLPAIFFIFVFGYKILYIFGVGYLKAYSLLKILTFSSIFVALNTIYVNLCRVKKKINTVILIYMFISLFTIATSYILVPIFGVNIIGLSWLVANLIVSLIVCVNCRLYLFCKSNFFNF